MTLFDVVRDVRLGSARSSSRTHLSPSMRDHGPPSPPAGPSQDARHLDSWGEIAAHLHRSISTVQRWEKLEGLPVHNLSGTPEQDYFSDGLTEELITHLARLRPDRLAVIARTSSMQYRDTA